MDYLFKIFQDNIEYFDSFKDSTREELEGKLNKNELIELLLDNITPQILEEYFYFLLVFRLLLLMLNIIYILKLLITN